MVAIDFSLNNHHHRVPLRELLLVVAPESHVATLFVCVRCGEEVVLLLVQTLAPLAPRPLPVWCVVWRV